LFQFSSVALYTLQSAVTATASNTTAACTRQHGDFLCCGVGDSSSSCDTPDAAAACLVLVRRVSRESLTCVSHSAYTPSPDIADHGWSRCWDVCNHASKFNSDCRY